VNEKEIETYIEKKIPRAWRSKVKELNRTWGLTKKEIDEIKKKISRYQRKFPPECKWLEKLAIKAFLYGIEDGKRIKQKSTNYL